MARSFRTLINRRPALYRAVQDLLATQDLAEQQKIFYDRVAPKLFGRTVRWILGRQMTMNMLGVPREQGLEVKASHQHGIAGFIESCIESVCCQLPFHENYFWRVYLTGQYSKDCCPRYLTREGFETLKAGRVEAIRTETTTMTEHLKQRDKASVSKFVLLDHMDWMGSAYPDALREEWRELLRVARPNSQMLFRSGAHQPKFIDAIRPYGETEQDASLRDLLTFNTELAERLHPQDRVHTYASFHIATPRSVAAPAASFSGDSQLVRASA